MRRLQAPLDEPDGEAADDVTHEFRAALEDDLDVPRALDVLERASGATARGLAGVVGLHPEALA